MSKLQFNVFIGGPIDEEGTDIKSTLADFLCEALREAHLPAATMDGTPLALCHGNVEAERRRRMTALRTLAESERGCSVVIYTRSGGKIPADMGALVSTPEDVVAHVQAILKQSRLDMARLRRFAPAGHPYFVAGSLLNQVFENRFQALGGMSPEISKQLGFEEARTG